MAAVLVSRFTIRDLFAGVLAIVLVIIIGALAGFERSIPDVLFVMVALAGGYFFRGAENGGLGSKRGNDQ